MVARSGSAGRASWLVPSIIAAVLLPAAVVVLARVGRPDSVQGDDRHLRGAIEERFPGDSCTPPDVALEALRRMLDISSDSGWMVRVLAGAQRSRCVSVTLDAEHGWVLVVPGSDRQLSAELSELRRHALRECLTREQLVALVASIAARSGVAEFGVLDGGPITIPTEDGRLSRADQQAALNRYARGCYLYSGLTWAPDGKPVFVLAGRPTPDTTASPS